MIWEVYFGGLTQFNRTLMLGLRSTQIGLGITLTGHH